MTTTTARIVAAYQTAADPTAPSREPACRNDPELWFSTRTGDRALAMHICRTHCPLYEACRQQAADNPARASVHGGVLYTDTTYPQPFGTQPRPSGKHCDTCAAARPADTRPATAHWDDCGTYPAHQRHVRYRQVPCGPCAQARREYDRQRLPAKRATSTPAPPKRRRTRANLAARAEREQLAARIGELTGLRLPDRTIGLRLGIPGHKVRRIREAHSIPSGTAVVTSRVEPAAA